MKKQQLIKSKFVYISLLFLCVALFCAMQSCSRNIEKYLTKPVDTTTRQFSTFLTKTDIENVYLSSIVSDIESSFNEKLLPYPSVQNITDNIRYTVTVSKIIYKTKNADGSDIEASGLVFKPNIAAGDRRKAKIICLMHGTVLHADSAPSVSYPKGEYAQLAKIFSSMGALVVIPDYAGFGVSSSLPHFYEDVSVGRQCVDMILAAKEFYKNAIPLSDSVFLSGYGQGGTSSIVTHKYIEENSFPLVLRGSIAGSSPIDKLAFAKYICVQTQPISFMPFYLWVLESYKNAYNITYGYHQIFAPLYDTLFNFINYDFSFALNKYIAIDEQGAIKFTNELYGNQALINWVNTKGKPQDIFSGIFNPSLLFSSSFRLGIRDDSAELSEWIRILKINSPIDWTPKAKLTFIVGEKDAFIFPFSSEYAYSKMKEKGANVELQILPGENYSTTIPLYTAHLKKELFFFLSAPEE